MTVYNIRHNSKYITANNKIMLKDHFQRSTAALNNLRSEHFKVSEYLNKGRYRLKQKFFGKGKKHYDFDINSQEFFHEYIDDIIFEPTEIQQTFYNEINKTLQVPISFSNKIKIKDSSIGIRKNPSQVRVTLARHFHNRSNDLSYKKYQTLLRVHNLGDEEHLTAVKSRTNLIDKQIQQCLSRQSRLEVEDYYEMSYVQGGKPVPVNENGQPIYKYLDEEDCWFSNINRDDVQAYLRNNLFRDELLSAVYWPYWHQLEYLVFSEGLQLAISTEQEITDHDNKIKSIVIEGAKKLINKLEKGLENLSPGNLQQKQNLNNFIYNITGINNDSPLTIPLYPSIIIELLDSYNKIVNNFFKQLTLNSEKQVIDVLPKLNSFCTILFKYQNQEILEGEKQIRLGLEDEVDIKKELVTMLEQQWVQRHIKIDFDRFEYKMYLKPIDWEMDTYSQRLQKQVRVRTANGYIPDFTLAELVRTMRLTTYGDFRKIMKKRSEKIVERLSTKYEDMELTQQYDNISDEQINKQKLIEFYKAKTDDLAVLFKKNPIKESTKKFFNLIIKDYIIKNPVEIQIAQTLSCIKIRQLRTKTLNILNAMRCYQRNINLDLRVIDGCEFKFQMDDEFLINSNKQVVEKFEKNVKDNETSMSKVHSNHGPPALESEDFLIHGSIEKPMLYKKDKIQRHFFNEEIPHLFVIDGKRKRNILYDIAQEDLKLVEDRILETGTYFINKYERIIKMRQLSQLVDRMDILSDLFELEERYLYQKFNLIENYYYLYENTVEPLHAHKIGKIIMEIMYEQPKIDLNSDYFRNSYEILIETMKQQSKIVKLWTKMIEDEEKEKNKVFHKKFASLCEIPLTLWAYAYGDMEIKGAKTYNKLQRMNSVSSKMSKNSKSSKDKNVTNQLREQIREQFGEDSDEQEAEPQQQLFNIEQYDEYLLRRNMDDIFDEIVGGAEAPKQAKEKDGLGVSSLGLENLTVHPKFEGGPHVLHNYLPEITITSHHNQKLLNFSQNICWVSNLHQLIQKLVKEARERYGFCSQQYQLRLKKQICLKIHKILLQPTLKLEPFFEFQTDDFYHETVTADSKRFDEIMHPILDLPSALQLSLHSTHEKHQNTLPNMQILQKFDLNILASLVRLEKPLNSATYRELNLSINLIQFTRIKQRLWHLQHQREQIFNAYKILGSYCDIPMEKYAHCYGRSGQSDVFLASSEAKIYSANFLKRPCFNESIQQLRAFYELEQAQLYLFRSSVDIAKLQIEDYVRLSFDMEKNNKNCIINRNDILLSTDKKNVKMIANRVKGHANSIAGEVLKTRCYLKQKLKVRSILEQKIKAVNEISFDELALKHYLSNDTKKYNKNCQVILAEKMKRVLIRQYIKKYTLDLKASAINNINFIGLLRSVDAIRNYSQSLPYLSKLLIIPTQFQQLNKKAFYDQKKQKIVEQDHKNGPQNICYIESKEELMENWDAFINKCSTTNLQNTIHIENFVKSTLPPANKDELFKWMFKIPTNKIVPNEKQSLKHLLRVFEPFTGRTSVSQYRYSTIQKGSRNKFTELYDKYSIILEYLQSNLMLICLQNDSDIINSIFSIIDHRYKFDEKYPLHDEAAIYETDPSYDIPNKQAQYLKDSPMSSMFVYESRKQEFTETLNKRMDDRNYRPEKVHWAVSDEILDFICAKVEGYGIIRHCMLELKDEISLFTKVKPEVAIQYMKSKTQNILNIFWLSLWRTFNTKNQSYVHMYVPKFLDLVLSVPKLEDFQAPMSKNARRGIDKLIQINNQQDEQQKARFQKGVYQLQNNMLDNKLKVIYNFLPINLVDFMEQYIYKSELTEKQIAKNQNSELYLTRHNWNFMSDFRDLVVKPDKQFRLSLFAKMREFFELGKVFLSTKTQKSEPKDLLELEEKKTPYYQYLIMGKVHMIALTSFKLSKYSKSFPDTQQKFWINFNETLQINRQIVDINTFNIYDQLEAYQDSGKIIFSKTEQGIIANNAKIHSIRQQNNKIVRMVIFNKLAVEQFKNQVLEVATKLLKAEKTPKTEGKKIQNTSLIPRVHLISSFSSPLIIERKTYISQQYKLAFVQAFINRFRNKVSRVDLLSSGYGFVITVPDLEDCVNYMNKLLFTFTEKQFRARLETFSQYYEILIEGLRSRNQTINQQKSIIKHLQDKVKNTLEAQYLSKVSKLLEEKILIEEKLRLAEQSSNGLQHRVRKAVKHEYQTKIKSLQTENEELRGKFQNFKDVLIKLTKDLTKNNFLSLVNILKDQVSTTLDKKIDLSESFKAISEINTEKGGKNVLVKEQEKKDKSNQIKREYDQDDIQRCKIGEDIIHDPYYVTKLINKMRIFNVFKLATKTIKHEFAEQKKTNEITSLHKIQDRVISQTERQAILRSELIKAQQQLSKKSVELERVKHSIEALQNEKAKLKILLVTKQKKIEQKQRQNEQIKKKIDGKSDVTKMQSKISIDGPEKSVIQQEQLPRISAVRQQKISRRKISKEPFLTNLQQKSGSLSLYEKFELSNKDSTWREKCEQLYLENKKLLGELQKVKEGLSGTVTPNTRDGYSLNMRNKRTADLSEKDSSRSEKRKFTNLSFKYGVMKG